MSAPHAPDPRELTRLTTLYDQQYAAVCACYAAGLEPWTLRETPERGRYVLVRGGVVEGPVGSYTEQRALLRCIARNVWAVRHARKVARLEREETAS